MNPIKALIFLVSLSALLSSCGVYNNNFEKGGELTSSFLDRIKENPKGEDLLLPSNEERLP
ncbi:MAG: hypothetical protein K1060chlam2_00578 [Chlamydiae bacterium]|nr:hypothetical protein [Chlamydiota bacterium]